MADLVAEGQVVEVVEAEAAEEAVVVGAREVDEEEAVCEEVEIITTEEVEDLTVETQVAEIEGNGAAVEVLAEWAAVDTETNPIRKIVTAEVVAAVEVIVKTAADMEIVAAVAEAVVAITGNKMAIKEKETLKRYSFKYLKKKRNPTMELNSMFDALQYKAYQLP